MGALTLAITALETLPTLISASEQVLALISSTTSALKAMQAENRDPTDAEWQAMHDQIAAIRAQLHS